MDDNHEGNSVGDRYSGFQFLLVRFLSPPKISITLQFPFLFQPTPWPHIPHSEHPDPFFGPMTVCLRREKRILRSAKKSEKSKNLTISITRVQAERESRLRMRNELRVPATGGMKILYCKSLQRFHLCCECIHCARLHSQNESKVKCDYEKEITLYSFTSRVSFTSVRTWGCRGWKSEISVFDSGSSFFNQKSEQLPYRLIKSRPKLKVGRNYSK